MQNIIYGILLATFGYILGRLVGAYISDINEASAYKYGRVHATEKIRRTIKSELIRGISLQRIDEICDAARGGQDDEV